MKFIIGIGNEEQPYENTRHNVGFKVVERVRAHSESKANTKPWSARSDLKALTARVDDRSVLVKSTLFVNNTGETVTRLLKQHPEASAADYLFVCDDVNLRFGKLRLRDSGSSGGHHGLESVIAAFASDDFPRLRIGVGVEDLPRDLTDFVLQPFSSDEEKDLSSILEKAALICESWLKDGYKAAQAKLSQKQSIQ